MPSPTPSPAVLGVALLAACSGQPEPPSRVPARNLLLVSIDTVRADHAGHAGYERDTTPHLDALAERGTVFLTALSSASWTVPAHMSMLTGLDAGAHGLLSYPNPGRLAPQTPLLAETLAAAGFRTAAFTGGGFVSPQHGFERGFEEFQSKGRRFGPDLEDAVAWLASVPREERFFLFLHGFDAHGPYRPKRRHERLFLPEYAGDYDVSTFRPASPRPSPEDLEYVIAQYDGAIRSADEELGRVLDALEADGRLAETLVVVTSDHGEEFYEHGSIEHTHSLHEELLRVLLVFAGPNVPVGRSTATAGLIDITPTALDLLAVPAPGPMQGEALFPADGATPDPDRALFSYVDYSLYPYRIAAVRTSRWKLLAYSLAGMAEVDLEAEQDRRRYTWRFRPRAEDWIELYDLEADPEERVNVADQHEQVVTDLLARLQEHRAASAGLGAAPEEALPPDEDYTEALRALGYVE